MTRVLVVSGLLLLCTSAVSAAPPPDVASFLSSLNSSCATPMQTAAGKKDGPGGITAFAYCSANCGGYSVSCSGGTCSAVDRNCAVGQQGYVQCDGATTYCSPSCGVCNEGWVEWRDGGCCQGGYQKYHVYECINGAWSHVDTFCDSVTCF